MLRQSMNRFRLIVKGLTNLRMDVFELLAADHFKIDLLFIQLKAARSRRTKEDLFERIKSELQLHLHAEETVFYPACKNIESLKEMTLRSLEEHKQIKTL